MQYLENKIQVGKLFCYLGTKARGISEMTFVAVIIKLNNSASTFLVSSLQCISLCKSYSFTQCKTNQFAYIFRQANMDILF